MRVVATRIERDGTMLRRVVGTAQRSDGPGWEDLARRALAVPPPYRPVPGATLYHISLDDGREVLVAEDDMGGPLLDLVTAVLAIGDEVLARRVPLAAAAAVAVTVAVSCEPFAGCPATTSRPHLSNARRTVRPRSAPKMQLPCVLSLRSSAYLGNGAVVGVEDGLDHADVEPVGVGMGLGDREHPE